MQIFMLASQNERFRLICGICRSTSDNFRKIITKIIHQIPTLGIPAVRHSGVRHSSPERYAFRRVIMHSVIRHARLVYFRSEFLERTSFTCEKVSKARAKSTHTIVSVRLCSIEKVPQRLTYLSTNFTT